MTSVRRSVHGVALVNRWPSQVEMISRRPSPPVETDVLKKLRQRIDWRRKHPREMAQAIIYTIMAVAPKT